MDSYRKYSLEIYFLIQFNFYGRRWFNVYELCDVVPKLQAFFLVLCYGLLLNPISFANCSHLYLSRDRFILLNWDKIHYVSNAIPLICKRRDSVG